MVTTRAPPREMHTKIISMAQIDDDDQTTEEQEEEEASPKKRGPITGTDDYIESMNLSNIYTAAC